MVPVDGGGPSVMAGATGVGLTVIEKAWEANGVTPSPTPLVAVTTPVNRPGVIGKPEIRPEGLKVSPSGRAPAVTLKAGVG